MSVTGCVRSRAFPLRSRPSARGPLPAVQCAGYYADSYLAGCRLAGFRGGSGESGPLLHGLPKPQPGRSIFGRRSIKWSTIGIRPRNPGVDWAPPRNSSSSSRPSLRGMMNIESWSASAAHSMCTRWTARSNRTPLARPPRRAKRCRRRRSDCGWRSRQYCDPVRPLRCTGSALTSVAGALTSRAALRSGPRAPHRPHSPWRSARARRGCAARATRSPWHRRDSARRDRVPGRPHRLACAW